MDYIESGYSKLLKYSSGLDLSAVDSGLGNSFEGGSATIGSGSSNVLTNPITDSRNPEAIKEGTIGSQWDIGRNAFIVGGATGYNSGTGFFLGWDSTAYKFFIGNSSGDKLTWDGTTLTLVGTITIVAGTIAGLTITATALTATAGGNTTIVSSSTTAFTAGPTGAPTFTVTQAGALVASSATITGIVTANTGYIGGTSGWVIAAGKITSTGIGVATSTGDATYAFWAGDDTPGSAEFRVAHTGALTATSATITGAITASSGSITGAFSVLGAVTVGTAGSIGSGQTAYNTGTGWWMENNTGSPRLSIGNASTNYLTWNNTTLSVAGTVTITAGSVLNTYPTDASIVLFLSMDEGTGSLTRDATTNAYNGTIAAGVSYGSGVSGTCLVFTAATNSTVSISNSAVNGLDDFSISFWCTLTELTTAFRCALSCATALRTNEFFIGYEPALNRWNVSFVNVEYVWSGSTIEDGAFHHVCVTRSGTTATFYLDGVSLGTNTVSTDAFVVDSGGFILGQDQDSVGGGYDATQAWVGKIDELRIYNVVLTALQVYSLFQLPSANSSQGVKALGGAYASASSGARVLLFPDANTAIQVIDNGAADVFKVLVGGTDVGDVIMGSESGGKYAKWDKSASTFSVTGPILTSIQSGSDIDGQYLTAASVASASANLSLRGWTQTSAFSVTDADTVAWATSGTFTASDGTSYSIGAGSTGNMIAATRYYIYLDIAVSTTAYQSTTTATTAVGNGKVLVATAFPGTNEATFQVFNGTGGLNISGLDIALLSITAGEIANTTITAGKIVSGTITTTQIAANTIVAGNIAAGTITTTEIAANTIVAGNIAAGTITTNEIAANTIVAGNIAAATITTTEIAATTIIGSNISSLSISGKSLIADTGTIGGWTMGATTLTGTGVTLSSTGDAYIAFGTTPPTSPTVGTGVFINKTGLFGLSANTQNFKISATDGSITSISGTIAAFTIAGTTLSATNLTLTSGVANTANITVGTGATAGGLNSANAAGDIVFWAGSTFANRATAAFRVEADGTITATDAVITGSITTTTGAIGGFTIGATTLSATNLTLTSGAANTAHILVGTSANVAGLNSGNAAGDIGIWAGATHANRATAPFRVEMDGSVIATDVTVTGAITANTGSVAGVVTINGSTALNVQNRAETLFVDDFSYVGHPTDTDAAITEFFSIGTGAGSVTRYVLNTRFIDSTGDNWTFMYSVSSILCSTIDDGNVEYQDKDMDFYVTAEFSGTTNQDAYLGLGGFGTGGGNQPANDATETKNHIGFYFQDGTIFASNANGTTQTKTDVSSGITMTNMNLYWFTFDTGTNIKYYINDVLVATHTTNLPTANTATAVFMGLQGVGANLRSMDIKNNYIIVFREP